MVLGGEPKYGKAIDAGAAVGNDRRRPTLDIVELWTKCQAIDIDSPTGLSRYPSLVSEISADVSNQLTPAFNRHLEREQMGGFMAITPVTLGADMD